MSIICRKNFESSSLAFVFVTFLAMFYNLNLLISMAKAKGATTMKILTSFFDFW